MKSVKQIIREEIDNYRGINETTYKVYHGTNEKFSNFNFKRATQGIVWFTNSIDSIQKGEHGGQGSKYIMTRYITINNPAGWEEYEKYGLGQLQDMGYDGVILPQGNKTDYFVFSPKSISAKEPTGLNEDDYRGEHTAPTREDSPMHDVTNAYGEDIYGSMEKAVRYFGAHRPYDMYSIGLIQRARNKPNMPVKIYRAVPAVLTNQEKINDYEKQKAYILKTGRLPQGVDNWKDKSEYYDYISDEIDKLKSLPAEQEAKTKINSGDWVTINPAYAKEHGKSNLNNKYKVLTKTVSAKNLFTDGNDIHEWGYSENIINEENVKDKNLATWKKTGKKFWIGCVNILDGEIEEVHTYEEAKRNDFHHSFYFSPNMLEKIQDEECMVFWVDEFGINGEWTHGKIPQNIINKISNQIIFRQ